jgi:hypothetical protein
MWQTSIAQATRDRSAVKTAGGKIIRVEAHPIPEHPRPKRVQGRAGLVGDAAGYVTKCSGAPLSPPQQSAQSHLAAVADRQIGRDVIGWRHHRLQLGCRQSMAAVSC